MIEMEAVERKRSRGGFLNLFDWPGKSRKKLFSSSSTTSELPEESKQEKQNAQNLSKSWPSPIEVDETGKSLTYNPRSDSSCSTSTVTSDDGQGSRAPSVVARLMGLESLPVPNSLEPRPTSDFDPFFLRPSRKVSRWDAYENLGYVNLRTDYDDGISWEHLDSRMRNRPIDRFQSETLPPRSAKPISVTHNRLLSPIRSPGFVQSRNPAYVIEAASRMIESSPRIAAKARISPSDSSSSLPMRIRDLKDKLEASQKGTSPQISNGTRNNKYSRGKHDEKRTTSSSLRTQETNKLLGKNRFDGLKGKAHSVATHAKANTIPKQGSSTPSSGNRGQKEKMETKNRVIKNGLKESSSSSRKTMVKPNNQKQNQYTVMSVSNQKGSKVMNKVVNKVLVESGATSKKPGFTATSAEKNTTSSLSCKKNLPCNRKPPNGVQEPGTISEKRIKRGGNLIKCNITVDGGLKTGEDDRKKDMDVISFTFSSPIKGLSSDSLSSTKKTYQDTESALSFNKMDSDSLNIVLEQKLKELTSKIESSCSSLTQEEESSGSISKDWVNGTISLPSDDMDKGLSESESVSDCTSSFYNNRKFQAEEQEVNSFGNVTEAEDLQIYCSKSFSTSRSEIEETEVSETEEGEEWELEYITEIIASGQLMIKECSLGMATDILPLSLFDEIEGKKRDVCGKIKRKTVFDFVNQCLTLKCEKMFMGSCRGLLGKEGIFFERKEISLAEEVKKEIDGLKKMREMMMDELVDSDMSSGVEGKWLDYKRETYEEGIEIEEEIVSELVDDLINDLLLCF